MRCFPYSALAVAVLLLAGCTGEALVEADYRLAETTPPLLTVQEAQGPVFVLNAQLRPFDQASQAWGHIQIKLHPPEPGVPPPDDGFEWTGMIFNPAEETFTSGGLFDLGHPPEPGVPPGISPVFTFEFENGRVITLAGEGRLPEGEAAVLMTSPENFMVAFETAGAGWAIGGGFNNVH